MSAGLLSLFASGIEPSGAVVIDPSENPELCLYRERTLAFAEKVHAPGAGHRPHAFPIGKGDIPKQGEQLPDDHVRRCGNLCA